MKKMSCQIEQVRNKVHIKINKHWHIFTLISFYIKKNKLTFKIYRRSVYFIIERWKHHESGRLSDTAAEERITEGGGGGDLNDPKHGDQGIKLMNTFLFRRRTENLQRSKRKGYLRKLVAQIAFGVHTASELEQKFGPSFFKSNRDLLVTSSSPVWMLHVQ